VVPITEFGPETAAATASLLDQDYPGLAVTLAATRADGAALAAAARFDARLAMVETPAAARGVNPKVANLGPPLLAATQDLVLMKDARTVLPPGHLRAMAAQLTPGVGLVVSAPIGVGPVGLAAAVEAATMNGYGARLLLTAAALGIDVGIGAAMLVRREDMVRAQALASMAATPADDHALAKAMRRISLATAFTARPVVQRLGRRSGAAVWRRHRRWALCRRREEPAAFLAEPACGLLAVALCGALAAPELGLDPPLVAVSTILLWLAAETTLTLLKGWPLPPALPLAILIREAAMPALWLSVALAPPRGRSGPAIAGEAQP
jgi:ceramide glucosyltransferase